jgi:PAS domain S-box-containing protein
MSALTRPRVLIVSSNARLRARAQRALAERYDVEAASGWLDAERLCQSGLSLIVADERDGLSARVARLEVPIVVLRSQTGGKILGPARPLLGDASVRAGFMPEELVERVELQLELARLRAGAAHREQALVDEAGEAKERLLFLVSATQALTSSLKLSEILGSLCGAAVPRLAQWCVIMLLEGDQLVMKAAWHQEPDRTKILDEMGRRYLATVRTDRRHPVARVLTKGTTEFAAEVQVGFSQRIATTEEHLRLLRELDLASYVCVPLRSRGQTIGVLMLGADTHWRKLTRVDVVLAEELAFRAGTAVERAQLYEAVQVELAVRKRAEEEVRRHEREQHLILDTVHAMIWFKDQHNRILRCNRAAAEWAGMPAAEIEGRRAEDIFPAKKAREYQRSDLEVITSGQPKLGELEETTARGGVKRWIRKDTIPYRDEKGRIVGVVIFAIDVTESKRAEDSLRASEALQREFVANVSHEFRTPVASIKGFAQTLRAGAWRKEADRERFLRIIESNADRLTGLLEDLLLLSSLEAARPSARGDVDVRRIAIDCAEGMLEEAKRRKLSVAVSVPRKLRARVERGHLAHVFEQLLGNAIKFNKPGGHVKIRARRRGADLEVAVEDGGIGVEAAHLPRLFDRFYRVSKGNTPGSPGLGLHLVKKVAESYGGRVDVRSEPGRGSTFSVTLPAVRTPRAPRRRRGAAPADRPRR